MWLPWPCMTAFFSIPFFFPPVPRAAVLGAPGWGGRLYFNLWNDQWLNQFSTNHACGAAAFDDGRKKWQFSKKMFNFFKLFLNFFFHQTTIYSSPYSNLPRLDNKGRRCRRAKTSQLTFSYRVAWFTNVNSQDNYRSNPGTACWSENVTDQYMNSK